MIKRLLQTDLFANRYYAFGLAVQKGAPYLIIPLAVWAFGAPTYADYVLTFSAAQLAALAMSLGTTNSLVVFWYQQDDKRAFVRSLTTLIFLIGFPIGVIVIALLVFAPILPQHTMPHVLWAVLIVIYAAIYNWNAVCVSLIRVTERSKQYFYVVSGTTFLLLIMIVAASRIAHGVVALLSVYMFVLAAQSALFQRLAPKPGHGARSLPDFPKFTKSVFNYSLPIFAYSLTMLSVFTLDKWVIKRSYPPDMFTQYVLNYQFAYAINIVSVVIAMYLLPILCKLIEANDLDSVGRKVTSNYLLCGLGTFGLAASMYIYASVSGIHLTGEYWIMVAAFGVTNLFTVNVGVLEAFLNSRTLAAIVSIPTLLFWAAFVYAAHRHALIANYVLFLVYYVVLFFLSLIELRRRGIRLGRLQWT